MCYDSQENRWQYIHFNLYAIYTYQKLISIIRRSKFKDKADKFISKLFGLSLHLPENAVQGVQFLQIF